MKQIYNLKTELPEIQNSFSWTKDSMNDRVPTQLQKYGLKLNDENLHLYMVVALHPLYGLKKHFGTVDIPRDEVLKSTYAAIDKGCEIINHTYPTNPDFITKVIDAEFESERQEYIIASNDPEIYRLINEGFITAVSIQGKPRAYIENCGHCSTGNCDCKLVTKGFVLGINDGNSVSWVMTKDGNYNNTKIVGEIPHDKNTSIEIMLTETKSKSISLLELEAIPRENLHLVFDTSFKVPEVKLNNMDNPPQDPPAGNDSAPTVESLKAEIDGIKSEVSSIKSSIEKIGADMGEQTKAQSAGLEEIKNSIKALVATDEATKKHVEEVKNTQTKLKEEITKRGESPEIVLTEFEKELIKSEAIQNEPLKNFI